MRQCGVRGVVERQCILGSNRPDPSHWTLTTVTKTLAMMSRVAAIDWRCSSLMTDRNLELLFSNVLV